MATKRQLKKYVRNTCGALASEIILAHVAFPAIDGNKVSEIVTEIASLQCSAIARVGISYDKAPRDFESKNEYRKDRRAYFATAYNKLVADFNNDVLALVKKMNAALPEEVRQTIKETVA